MVEEESGGEPNIKCCFFGSNYRPNWPKMSYNLFGIYVTLETYSFFVFLLTPLGAFLLFLHGGFQSKHRDCKCTVDRYQFD